MIKIRIDDIIYEVEGNKTIKEIIDDLNLPESKIAVAAVINNQIYRLNHIIEENCELNLLTREDRRGNRIYRRSLFMLLAKAIYELYPDCYLSIEHSLSNGIYCEIHKDCPLGQEELKEIKFRMKELVSEDIPIKKWKLDKKEAAKMLQEEGFDEKVANLNTTNRDKYILYELEGYYNYFYHEMVPSTGYLEKFDLSYRMPGFVLLFPRKENPNQVPEFINQPKLANIFLEYEKLGEILGVGNVSELNQYIENNNYNELVRISEGLHEKQIVNIANKISSNIDTHQIILIAGPSSSGKTTFTHRLSIQLKINGLNPVTISTDDYFVNRENTPVDEDGNYDFEALEAIDLELFNKHLLSLLRGDKIELPHFNFQTGKREYHGNYLQIEEDQPVLIEGIHGLNDRLTKVIPQNHKFKIYVSALTQLNIDRHNRIPTSDTRLIRRIIRDELYRGHDASQTIAWWSNVRRGEEKNIFPYQENADIMFNSALVYELAVLKKYALDALQKIEKDNPGYLEARRLLETLSCFKAIPDPDIPSTSILKEFIGGSAFRES